MKAASVGMSVLLLLGCSPHSGRVVTAGTVSLERAFEATLEPPYIARRRMVYVCLGVPANVDARHPPYRAVSGEEIRIEAVLTTAEGGVLHVRSPLYGSREGQRMACVFESSETPRRYVKVVVTGTSGVAFKGVWMQDANWR